MHNWDRLQEMPYDNQPQYTPPTVTRGGLYSADGLRDGVIVPGLQAVITGVLFGVAALAVTAWLALPFLAIGGTVTAVIMAVSWLAYRSRWQFVLEKITGADLNQDGYIGEPLPQQEPLPALPPVRVIVEENQGQHVEYIDLPHPEKIPELAAGLLQGKQFAQTVWVGHGLTRPQFDEIRSEMIKRGLARWRNPNAPAQGAELTARGKAVCRGIVEKATPPPLDRY